MRQYFTKPALYLRNRISNQYHLAEAHAERKQILRFAFTYVNKEEVVGDYLEFGILGGKSFLYAYRAAKRRGVHRRFFAFDSFQGLPKPRGVDAIFERFKEGELSSSLELFEQRLKKRRVDSSKVVIVPGWFDQTLKEQTRQRIGLKSASVIMVDCDLYASTVSVLDFITPLLQSGSIILFDDWFCYRADPNKGEQRAAAEWSASHPEIRLVEWRKFGVNGQAFIVHIQE